MLKKILAIAALLYAALAFAAVVDVNKATEAQLDSVKGIGPGTSKLILDERKKGEFKDWADFVARVKGVGEARAAKLSEEGLRVNGRLYKAAAAKDEKKDAKAAAKDEKKDTKAAAKDEKKAEVTVAAKPAASAAKPAASAAKPAASAAKK